MRILKRRNHKTRQKLQKGCETIFKHGENSFDQRMRWSGSYPGNLEISLRYLEKIVEFKLISCLMSKANGLFGIDIDIDY